MTSEKASVIMMELTESRRQLVRMMPVALTLDVTEEDWPGMSSAAKDRAVEEAYRNWIFRRHGNHGWMWKEYLDLPEENK